MSNPKENAENREVTEESIERKVTKTSGEDAAENAKSDERTKPAGTEEIRDVLDEKVEESKHSGRSSRDSK